MSLSLRIAVATPCTGEQLVIKQQTNFYAGSTGDFTYGIVSKSPSAAGFSMVVYDYGRSTACTPSVDFVQDPPDANDPTGLYVGRDSNGDPDPSVATATVTVYP